MSEAAAESTPAPNEAESNEAASESGAAAEQKFAQADVDRIVTDRVKRERAKFADYDELKKAAEGKKTAEDRIAELEGKYTAAETRALRSDIANLHGISPADRDLFLTGSDEETLKAQAARLAERDSERKKNGTRVPPEGRNPTSKPNDEITAVRSLFGSGA